MKELYRSKHTKLTLNRLNFVVEEIGIVKEGETAGQEYVKNTSFYSMLDIAIKKICSIEALKGCEDLVSYIQILGDTWTDIKETIGDVRA